MSQKLKEYKFHFLLIALLAFISNPLLHSISGIQSSVLLLINFTLLILAGFNTAERRGIKLLTVLLGLLTLISVWAEYFMPSNLLYSSIRMGVSLLLFCLLTFILVRHFMEAQEVHLRVILGAIAGFLLLGLIGGVAFEIMERINTGSILLIDESATYDFYYFSFISLLTVGYGDVLPVSGAAKSLSILISLVGQFYMTIAIAVFVGKYLNRSK